MGRQTPDRGHLRASSVILNGELGVSADGLVPEQELRERLSETPGLAERLDGSLVLVVSGERPPGAPAPLQGLAAPILAPPDRLAPACVIVGSGPPAQVCLRWPCVSSAHLTFQRDPRGWTCVDRSTHGTTLNGRRLSAGDAVPVVPGDLIALSQHVWLAVHTPASLLHDDPEPGQSGRTLAARDEASGPPGALSTWGSPEGE